MKLEKEILAILAGAPVLYLPGTVTGQAIPISGIDHGLLWWLQDDHSHAIPTDLTPTLSAGGVAFMRGDQVEYLLLPLDQADELDRADTLAMIDQQRAFFAQPDQASFLAMVIEGLKGAEPGAFPHGRPVRPPTA